jgi:acyl-homoserine-lactone acylase
VLAVLLLATTAAAACSDDDGSAPPGDLIGDGDRYEATIRRTEGGVPHITGDSIADVVFGQGYASGEDRTCDLADQVIKVRGERARTFGPGEDDANVRSDLAWKVMGVHERATEDWADVSDGVAELVTAFTDGWNAHLAEVGADGVAGWCKGEDWVQAIEPVDVYAYARSVTVYASGAQLADYIVDARPPGEPEPEPVGTATTGATGSTGATGTSDGGDESALGAVLPRPVASNGWAIGRERSATGGGMLVANPHFPWEGELRFWESHLTIPGELDAYGVQLSGLPGIGIGFNEDVAWTHTVSAGNRFTAYTLQLVPGKPTSYRYGDEEREMTATDVTVEVLGDDGEVDEVTRTMWSSHYGPIVDVRAVMDIPQLGWTEETALTYRDANIDNDEILDQYLAMVEAHDLDELIAAHEEHQGIPLFNTIATDRTGRAWYADTSATPNLSPEAIAAFEASVETDLLVGAAVDNGLVLLDGSDPVNEWVDDPGARDPGLVGFDRMPMVERDDYVFNANDSYWLPHATEVLDGDHSPLHGWPATPRTPRTRENAVVLDDTSAEGPSGEDGKFDLDELADASLQNIGYTARALRAPIVERCRATPSLAVEALTDDDGTTVLPAATVDLAEACAVLDAWDGVYDLDRAGPVLFRELLSQLPFTALIDQGALWAEPFDPADPVGTPGGLAPAPPTGPDPVLVHLARAVQVLELAGLPVDVPLGEVQVALRDGERIPIHGGGFVDGTTNVVGGGGLASYSILDDAIPDLPAGDYAPTSGLGDLDGEPTYGVANGTSFLLAVAFDEDGPRAKAFLTYGNTEDRGSDLYTEATQRFSDKEWRDVLLEADAIEDAATSTVTVRG